jgi:competence protein ComGC
MKRLLLVSTLIVVIVPAICMADNVALSDGHAKYCERLATKAANAEVKANKKIDYNDFRDQQVSRCKSNPENFMSVSSNDLLDGKKPSHTAPKLFRVSGAQN